MVDIFETRRLYIRATRVVLPLAAVRFALVSWLLKVLARSPWRFRVFTFGTVRGDPIRPTAGNRRAL
jgi:hypothetical protein